MCTAQLGEWIEFNTVVVRQHTATGTNPKRLVFDRLRRGLVVGMQFVHDSQTARPPILTHRQAVLLVAVSLHRRYRVFPDDAQVIAPPTPKPRRQTGPSAAVSGPVTSPMVQVANPSIGLQPIAASDLEVRIANEIGRLIGARKMFTAYQVTLALRAADPGLNIVHVQVRAAVHQLIEPVIDSGLYESETAAFGRDSAIRYVPC